MTRLALRLAALFLPFALLTAAPAAAQVLVQKPGSSEDWMILAVMATGAEADKVRFEAAATEAGFKPGRSKNHAGEDEVMIVVLPDAARAPFLRFYADARKGKFGALKLDIAITPWAAVREKRDFLDEARVFGADVVPVPGE